MELLLIVIIRFFIFVKFYVFKNVVYYYICKCGNLYVDCVNSLLCFLLGINWEKS